MTVWHGLMLVDPSIHIREPASSIIFSELCLPHLLNNPLQAYLRLLRGMIEDRPDRQGCGGNANLTRTNMIPNLRSLED